MSWLERTPTEYQLVSDLHKHTYMALNLRRSFQKSWHSKVIHYYAEKVVDNAELVKPLEQDDLEQMGGDVILDSSGRVLYSHHSEASVERPEPDRLVSVILNSQS